MIFKHLMLLRLKLNFAYCFKESTMFQIQRTTTNQNAHHRLLGLVKMPKVHLRIYPLPCVYICILELFFKFKIFKLISFLGKKIIISFVENKTLKFNLLHIREAKIRSYRKHFFQVNRGC